ncbi:MAG: hypothetical protein ABUT39_14255 [Acidobacteriota bacterium]
MNDDPTAEVLSFARSAVLRAIHAAASGAVSAIDEDTLMRVVPLLERHDLPWLREVLANENLPLDGRKEIYSYTGEISAPWSAGEERS